MNEITTAPMGVPAFPTKMSEASTAGVQRLMAALSPEGNGAYSISKALAPTGALREGLEKRVAWISAWHRPCGEKSAKEWVELMLGTLRLKVEDKAEAELRKRAYCLSMADLPLYAVQEACTAALRAQVGDATGKWAPQPGELHVAAKKHMEALVREKGEIMRVLKAVVREEPATTVEDRKEAVKRILEGVRSADKRTIPKNQEHLNLHTPTAAECRRAAVESLAEYQSDMPLPQLSDELLGTMRR